MVGQESLLVRHPCEYVAQAGAAQQAEAMADGLPGLLPLADYGGQVGAVGEQPRHPGRELRHGRQQLIVNDFHGKQRNQAYHRADAQADARVVGGVPR
ncbi:hypothetical protein [Hymenobacter nivis]|uniref:hypothetical protein n=1 Tax=Hymenobacter nivis TaxID=1850093 RepID=UPI0013A545CA|nr:hypothetical protein [Hymenobacter nivis]